jgi:hypothetical protein
MDWLRESGGYMLPNISSSMILVTEAGTRDAITFPRSMCTTCKEIYITLCMYAPITSYQLLICVY